MVLTREQGLLGRLLAALRSSDARARVEATRALDKLLPRPHEASQLLDAYREASVRFRALSARGEPSGAAVARDDELRAALAGAIARLGPQGEGAAIELLSAIGTAGPAASDAAVLALDAVAPGVAAAQLSGRLASSDEAERRGALRVLREIALTLEPRISSARARGGGEALPAIARALEGELAEAVLDACHDDATRSDALYALPLVAGSDPPAVLGELCNALHDPTAPSTYAALRSLATLGPMASPAIDALTALLEGPQAAAAAHALGCIGPSAHGALASLRRAASALDEAGKLTVQRAIDAIGAPPPEAPPPPAPQPAVPRPRAGATPSANPDKPSRSSAVARATALATAALSPQPPRVEPDKAGAGAKAPKSAADAKAPKGAPEGKGVTSRSAPAKSGPAPSRSGPKHRRR